MDLQIDHKLTGRAAGVTPDEPRLGRSSLHALAMAHAHGRLDDALAIARRAPGVFLRACSVPQETKNDVVLHALCCDEQALRAFVAQGWQASQARYGNSSHSVLRHLVDVYHQDEKRSMQACPRACSLAAALQRALEAGAGAAHEPHVDCTAATMALGRLCRVIFANYDDPARHEYLQDDKDAMATLLAAGADCVGPVDSFPYARWLLALLNEPCEQAGFGARAESICALLMSHHDQAGHQAVARYACMHLHQGAHAARWLAHWQIEHGLGHVMGQAVAHVQRSARLVAGLEQFGHEVHAALRAHGLRAIATGAQARTPSHGAQAGMARVPEVV